MKWELKQKLPAFATPKTAPFAARCNGFVKFVLKKWLNNSALCSKARAEEIDKRNTY
jgi:hypothetical protein